MSKKSKTTTNQTTVQTPTNPGWVTNDTAALGGRIASLANWDPNTLVPGADPLQTQASQGASQLGSDRSWLDNIMKAQPQQVQSASVLDGLQNYMSPYTNDVVNTSLADFDHNSDSTRAAQTLQMAGAGAFGGSGQALTRSATEDSLARARATLGAGLRDQAFNVGSGLSNSDANRRQDASSQNASLYQQMLALQGQTGLAGEQSDRANIGLQSDIGGINRGMAAQQAAAPLSLLQQQLSLFNQLPLNLFNGQTSNMTGTTTSKTSDPLGALGSLAMGAGALGFSPFAAGSAAATGMGSAGLSGVGLGDLGGSLGAITSGMKPLYSLAG